MAAQRETSMADSGTWVRSVWSELLAEEAEDMAASRATSTLERHRLFDTLAAAVDAGMPRDQRSAVTMQLIQLAPLVAHDVPRPLFVFQRLLGRLRQQVHSGLPEGEVRAEQRRRRGPGASGPPSRVRRRNDYEERLNVDKQKEAVVIALDRRRADIALRFTQELVAAQRATGRSDRAAKSLSHLAALAERRGFVRMAADWLEEAIALAPADAVPWTQLIALRRRQGETEVLAHFSEGHVARFPENPVAITSHAEVLRTLGRLDEALAVYDLAVARFPDNVFALNGRGVVLKALGRLDEAERAFVDGCTRFPESEFARTGRGEVLRARGLLHEALACHEETVFRFPHIPLVRNRHAEVLKALGRLHEAVAAYDETIALFPSDGFSRNGRARLLIALGRLDDAECAVDGALALFRGDMAVQTTEAELLRARRFHDLSVERLFQLRRRGPREDPLRGSLGFALLRSRREAEAQRILSDHQPPVTALQWYVRLALGLTALRLADLARARFILSRGVLECPFADHRMRFEHGLALVQLAEGDAASARRGLDALPEPDHALAALSRRILLAHGSWRQGHDDRAESLLAFETPFRHRVIGDLIGLLRRRFAKGAGDGDAALATLDDEILDAEIELLSL